MAKNVATVDDFEKLKNPDTGLVPMSFLVPTITERVGDIRGAEPYTALRWYNDGLAEPTAKLNAAPAQQQQRASTDPDVERKAAIEIPTAWNDDHHLQRIALAKKIAGSDASLTADQADKVIADELARRQVAGTGPNALTTQQTVTR
ncbi:hypothetical protein [Methylobacterium sp. PvR107]|uniref:hypothetical protein n=1 Tax=Methylobacterium sp. PvR107 TaxID=2806597 RepID=UPI001AE3032A|nr:hypothetical protein [Methylobacterium sp. PvR107]MBP1179981.1 hypothetical protein [Methylobacterium sp. PvR107]